MKRPALAVVVIYLAALVALTVPVSFVAFWSDLHAIDVTESMRHWVYWLFLAVMVAGQAALLVLPVKIASRRPTTRRSLLWPVLTAGFLMGLLVLGAVTAVTEFVRQGHAFDTSASTYLACAVGAVTWLAWGVIFARAGNTSTPTDLVTRQCRLLLAGSLLELLVAVPTHIVARSRGYCCAGVYTFVGIAFGLAVMLLSFGPAVYFLFVERWKRVHPPADTAPDV